MRKITDRVSVGKVTLGGGAPVVVQSMLSVPSTDIEGNVQQAQRLEKAGCQIIRAAVPDLAAVEVISALKASVSVPVVADIHFDYRLALAAVRAGADKIRINPGNIGSRDAVHAVADACGERSIPIRIGVNSGSVERPILEKYGAPTAEALVESAAYHASLLEEFGFHTIVLSLKSSDLATMIAAYRLASRRFPYPLHLGVTEAGTAHMGLVKSAIGIGSLLADGIGDTIRVSLTADPVEEVHAAHDILRALGTAGSGVQVISCPTCGRTRIPLAALAEEVENALSDCPLDRKVAVMGCVVNGPGEAREADYGIAGGEDCGLLFSHGKILGKYPQQELVEKLLQQIEIEEGISLPRKQRK